ncbi:hypothetical protein ABPG75_008085 [Micractinium tetrahymenae]
MAATTLSFEAILAGECGPIEAEAAKRWLDAGAPLYEPPSVLGMVYLEEGQQGLDMTIHRGQSGQRRRRTSGHGQLLASPVGAAAQPQGRSPAGAKPAADLGLGPGWQAVREVVQEGPILPPRKLIRYLRAAAANPLAAAAAAGSTRGLAHLLGLRRVRIVRIEEERQKLKRRLGQAGGGAAAAVPPSDRQLRRRS